MRMLDEEVLKWSYIYWNPVQFSSVVPVPLALDVVFPLSRSLML